MGEVPHSMKSPQYNRHMALQYLHNATRSLVAAESGSDELRAHKTWSKVQTEPAAYIDALVQWKEGKGWPWQKPQPTNLDEQLAAVADAVVDAEPEEGDY